MPRWSGPIPNEVTPIIVGQSNEMNNLHDNKEMTIEMKDEVE